MRFSVMGDSVSAYEGYIPFLYDVFYTEERARQAGLESVGDIWWMKVIYAFGGELCVNDSYSGSYVAGTTTASAHSFERIANLKREDCTPDIVLICMGANDCGGSVALAGKNADDECAFEPSYAMMLKRIKKELPDAKICCATIMLTDKEVAAENKSRFAHIEKYNDVIRRAAEEHGCMLLEMFDTALGYSTVDGLHPDRQGHQTLADRVIAEMKKCGFETV